MKKREPIMFGSSCSRDNIEWQVWADELDVVSDGDGNDEVWCHDCDEHTKSVLKEREVA